MRRRAVAIALSIFLVACITIPLAVYAASTDENSPDFEITNKAPVQTDIISAELQGGAFDPPSPSDNDSSKDNEIDTTDEPDDTEEPAENDDTSSVEDTDEPETTVDSSYDTAETPDTNVGMSDGPSDTAEQDITSDDITSEPENLTEAIPEETAPADTAPVETEPEETEETVNEFLVTIGFYDREAITCLTGPATLREILASAGYTLRESDRPTVSLDEMIESQSWIMIDCVTYETITESEAIPFETEVYEVQTVPRGTTQTVTYGQYGSRDKVYTVQYVNGTEVERTLEYEYVSANPVNQVDHYGTGGTFYAPDGTAYSYSHYIYVRATYYNIHGNTASGLPTGNSVMAVDPSVIPLGTQVYVMNDRYDMGIKIAADTGGAVKGNIIDIWMDENHPHYYEFAAQGVCDMIAYVLD